MVRVADDDNVSDEQAVTASVDVPSAGGQIQILASRQSPYVFANDSFFRWRLNGVLHSKTLVILAGTYTAAQLAEDLNLQVDPLVDGISFYTDVSALHVGVKTTWAFGPDASFEFVSVQDAMYGNTVLNGNPTGWGSGMTPATITGSADRYPQSYQTAGNYNLTGLTGLNIQIVVDGTDNVLVDNVVQVIRACAARDLSPPAPPPGDPQRGGNQQSELQQRPQADPEHRDGRHLVSVGPAALSERPPLHRHAAGRAKNGRCREGVPLALQRPQQPPCGKGNDPVDAERERHVAQTRHRAGPDRLLPRSSGHLRVGPHLRHLPEPVEAERDEDRRAQGRPKRLAPRVAGHKHGQFLAGVPRARLSHGGNADATPVPRLVRNPCRHNQVPLARRVALTGRTKGGRMTAGVAMRWLRRTSVSVLVWLAVAMTVVAGVPHSSCRCPDGRIKPFCSGSTGKKGGCCCDGECCCAKAGTACCCKKSDSEEPQGATGSCCGQRGSCCGHHGQSATNAPANVLPAVTGSCCTRTLVQPEVSTFLSPERMVVKDVALGALLAVPLAPLWDAPSEPWAFRQEHQRPPPTDLLTTLQRLLI